MVHCFYLNWSCRENDLADFNEIWQTGSGNTLHNTSSPDPCVAQEWPKNLQNKYNTANAKAPTAFIGRHWIFIQNIFGCMHIKQFFSYVDSGLRFHMAAL